MPPATDKVSYFGSILNVWSQPIEDVGPAGRDKGKGGKYLLLPPGYDGKKSKADLEKEGYFVYQTDSNEYGFSFRPRLYNIYMAFGCQGKNFSYRSENNEIENINFRL